MPRSPEVHDLDRRTFLGTLVGGVAGLGLLACGRAAGPAAGSAGALPRRLGLQLYTVRSLMERDVAGTLEAVAAAGYSEVETAGLFDLSPTAFRALLDRHGLLSPAAHIAIDALREDADAAFDAAATLGQQWVVVPWLTEDERTVEGFRRVAGELNGFGGLARDRGLRIAYHNHDFEFAELGGARGFDILMAETDPDLVDLELDLYWASYAGQDPVALFERYPGRFPLWHVKDMTERDGERTMTSVGRGVIDFARIYRHADGAGLRHAFVEQDNPADPLASIRASSEYLRRLPEAGLGS
jgi:sugar phosphate isomerase/epimerase